MAIRGFKGDLTPRRLREQHIKPKIVAPTPLHKRNCIVVDIDGTLFDVRSRWKIAANQAKPPSPKFWALFMNPEYLQYDIPNTDAASLLTEIQNAGIEIIYLGGRRVELLEHTRKQLLNNDFPEGLVLLRDKGRPTENFKISVLNRLKYESNIIVFIGDGAVDDYVGQTVQIPTVRVYTNRSWTDRHIQNIIMHVEKSLNN